MTLRLEPHVQLIITDTLRIASQLGAADLCDDRFDFWKWSRQALGLPGWLLGWSSALRAKVQARAAGNLARFVKPS